MPIDNNNQDHESKVTDSRSSDAPVSGAGLEADASSNLPDNADLDNVYDQLSEEAQQETDSLDQSRGFLSGAQPTLLREREREYDDREKQWIRSNVWLKAARDLAQQTQEIDGRRLKYLTLPAYYRLDVSLLLRENLLQVLEYSGDGLPRKVGVAAFENDPTKYARMIGHRPEFALFGRCPVEEALTMTTNAYYDELRELFPFDIVNLDLTTSLTPKHEGPYSRTMEAIDTVFRRQADLRTPWGLFLTFRNMPEDWEPIALEQLLDNLQSNLDNYPRVSEAFDKLYQETRVSSLHGRDPKRCIAQSVSKWLVDRANANNLSLDSIFCYHYDRYPLGLPKYTIYKIILVLSRRTLFRGIVPTKSTPRQAWMDDDIVSCVAKHKCLDVEDKLYSISLSVPSIFDDLDREVGELRGMVP